MNHRTVSLDFLFENCTTLHFFIFKSAMTFNIPCQRNVQITDRTLSILFDREEFSSFFNVFRYGKIRHAVTKFVKTHSKIYQKYVPLTKSRKCIIIFVKFLNSELGNRPSHSKAKEILHPTVETDYFMYDNHEKIYKNILYNFQIWPTVVVFRLKN